MRTIIGFHAIEESLRKGCRGTLYFNPKSGKRVQRLIDLARTANLKTIAMKDPELEKMCGAADHRGAVFATESGREKKTVMDLSTWLSDLRKEEALVVVLDEITDPHNFGAILRSADQFGADLVLTTQRRAAPETSVVMKTSAGAANYVPVVRVPNLRRPLQDLKEAGFWIYGAHMDGESLWAADLTGRVVIVMGSEGRGLGRLLASECDTLLSIPMDGHVDSLNVSVAAGICLYEIARQRAIGPT